MGRRGMECNQNILAKSCLSGRTVQMTSNRREGDPDGANINKMDSACGYGRATGIKNVAILAESRRNIVTNFLGFDVRA